jgi:uncharacterized integral membrane protein
MIRTLSILTVASLLALFVWLNWPALSSVAPVSLGWVTVQAPLGLLLLVPAAVLCLLLAAWQAGVLRELRENTRALRRKEAADREEASRLVDLRIDVLRALEASVHATATRIGELEERMEQARLLTREDDVEGSWTMGRVGTGNGNGPEEWHRQAP